MTLPSFRAASIRAGVTASAGGAAARMGSANSVEAVSAVPALSTSRRLNVVFIPALSFLASDAEDLAVARLDVLRAFLDARRIVLHHLDVLEGLAPRLLLGARMDRAQRADVDDELLAFRREHVALQEPCRVRIGCVLEDRVRPDRHRRAFGRIDDLDRLAAL